MPNFKNVGEDATQGEAGVGTPPAYRFDLLPPLALAAVAEVQHGGAQKYGEGTWRRGAAKDHLNKSLIHAYAYLAGDTTEKDGDPLQHLRSAACRMLFALDMLEEERQKAVNVNSLPPPKVALEYGDTAADVQKKMEKAWPPIVTSESINYAQGDELSKIVVTINLPKKGADLEAVMAHIHQTVRKVVENESCR